MTNESVARWLYFHSGGTTIRYIAKIMDRPRSPSVKMEDDDKTRILAITEALKRGNPSK